MLIAEKKITGLSVGGSYDQAHRLIDAIGSLVSAQPRFAEFLDVQRDKVVNKQTGSFVRCVTSSARASFGHLTDFIVADELSNWLKRDLWDSVLSTAGKKPCSLLIVLSNAGFKDSWQYEVKQEIERDPTWYFSRPDSLPSWITGLEEQRKHLPDAVFRRLWLNEWIHSDENGLSADDIDTAINQQGPMTGIEPGWVFAAGLDVGIVKDPTAFCVVGRHVGSHEVIESEPKWHHNSTIRAMQDTGHFPLELEVNEIHTDGTFRLRLADCQSWKPVNGKVDLEQVETAILEAHRRFKLQAVLYDPTFAKYLAQRLEKRGVNMIEVSQKLNNLQSMATHLIQSFAETNIDMHRDDLLISELKQLRIVEKRNGSFRIESLRTAVGHGDCVTAFQLAIKGCRENTRSPVPRTRLPLMQSTVFQPEFADTGTGWHQTYGMF